MEMAGNAGMLLPLGWFLLWIWGQLQRLRRYLCATAAAASLGFALQEPYWN